MRACRLVEDHYLAFNKLILSLTCTQEVTGSIPVRSTLILINLVFLENKKFYNFILNIHYYMKLNNLILLMVLFLFQAADELEVFNFILVSLGIILLVIILVYILLNSKQEK